MAHDLCDEMLDLLEQEEAALLQGHLDTLARLAPEKERLTKALLALPPSGADTQLTRMRQSAARNAALLAAARRGIAAARNRLRQLAEGPTLNTYDQRGQRQSLTPGARHVERRA